MRRPCITYPIRAEALTWSAQYLRRGSHGRPMVDACGLKGYPMGRPCVNHASAVGCRLVAWVA